MTAATVFIVVSAGGSVAALGWVIVTAWRERPGPAVHLELIQAQRAVDRANRQLASIERRWGAGHE